MGNKKTLAVFAVVIAGLTALFVYHVSQTLVHPHIWWGVWIGFIGFAFMTLASWSNSSIPGSMLEGKTVGVVIPAFNENIDAMLACIDSLVVQTRLPDRIYIVDDASINDMVHTVISAYAMAYEVPEIIVTRLPENVGKRQAQYVAFSEYEADVWVTVDSDTRLAPDALFMLLGPFEDEEMQAVSGRLLGWNWNQNPLTRLVDTELASAFATGKSAASAFDSLVVASGGLAGYRGTLIRNNLNEYMNETFRGRKVTAGDDRSLTQMGLRAGKTKYQEKAIGWTLLPVTPSHLIRQRMRWMASWYRGTLWCVRNLPMGWGLVMVTHSIFSFVTSIILLPLMIVGMALRPDVIIWLALYFLCLTLIRMLRLFTLPRPGMTKLQYFFQVCLTPFVTVAYFFGGIPLRLAALGFVFSQRWGTRRGVEAGTLT